MSTPDAAPGTGRPAAPFLRLAAGQNRPAAASATPAAASSSPRAGAAMGVAALPQRAFAPRQRGARIPAAAASDSRPGAARSRPGAAVSVRTSERLLPAPGTALCAAALPEAAPPACTTGADLRVLTAELRVPAAERCESKRALRVMGTNPGGFLSERAGFSPVGAAVATIGLVAGIT